MNLAHRKEIGLVKMTFGQYMLATACQLLSLHFVAIVKLKQRYKQRVYKYYRC